MGVVLFCIPGYFSISVGYLFIFAGRKSYIRLNARDGESISISNAAIGADTTESLKNAVSISKDYCSYVRSLKLHVCIHVPCSCTLPNLIAQLRFSKSLQIDTTVSICDCILENRPFCHISYFEKYKI